MPSVLKLGAMGDWDDSEDKGVLMRFELSTHKSTLLVRDVSHFVLSADRGTVCITCEEDGEPALRAYEAGAKPGEQVRSTRALR